MLTTPCLFPVRTTVVESRFTSVLNVMTTGAVGLTLTSPSSGERLTTEGGISSCLTVKVYVMSEIVFLKISDALTVRVSVSPGL